MEIDSSTLAGALTLLAAIGGIVLAAARAGAERGAEVAVENANWQEKLRQELEKTRGTERQEQRFEAYKKLWAKQRPLALYDAVETGRVRTFGPKNAGALLNAQSDWYFDDGGGLLLTTHARDFYFAWQELLAAVATVPGWTTKRSATRPEKLFQTVLRANGRGDGSSRLCGAFRALAYLRIVGRSPEKWPAGAALHAKRWRDDLNELASGWGKLTAERQFAVLQQVSSTLRTVMVFDIESRVR